MTHLLTLANSPRKSGYSLFKHQVVDNNIVTDKPSATRELMVIGGLAGIGMVMSFLGVAWSGSNSDSPFGSGVLVGLAVIGIWFLLGVFLFPRTVGMAFTPPAFATPIAFLIGWARNGFTHGLTMLALGAACFLAQFLIGILRPEAAY